MKRKSKALGQLVDARLAKIWRAVQEITDAGENVSNEIGNALRKLPAKERLHFVQWAGRAMGEIGDYIAEAARGGRL